jgi:hypothetical protein
MNARAKRHRLVRNEARILKHGRKDEGGAVQDILHTTTPSYLAHFRFCRT